MTTSYPKRRAIEAVRAEVVDGVEVEVKHRLEYLLHANGRVFLTPAAWEFYAHSDLRVATAAAFRFHEAATRAHGRNRVQFVGLVFDDPSASPRLRVEVTGCLAEPDGHAHYLTAALYCDGAEMEVAPPAPVPSVGPRFYRSILALAHRLARQMFDDFHAFARGGIVDMIESAGAL